MNFTAVAGPVTTTAFTFSSGVLSFLTMPDSTAFATAGVTVTDNDSHVPAFTGKAMGGDGYFSVARTSCRHAARGPTPSRPMTASAWKQRQPGLRRLRDRLDVQHELQLGLHAGGAPNDQVGGTSLFRVIPAPGTLEALGRSRGPRRGASSVGKRQKNLGAPAQGAAARARTTAGSHAGVRRAGT